ncbi:hypothetical protein [Lysobacter sp. CA199]
MVKPTWLIGARHAVIRLVPLGDRYIEQWLMAARCEANADESSG